MHVFDDDAYNAAVETHEFEAWLHDGEATFLVCAACDAEIWVQDGGTILTEMYS